MSKEIIINVTGEHSRIAIVEDGELVELYIENPENVRTIGDIYLSRVRRILPGIKAAFVDIGQKQDAFLHFSDLSDNLPALLELSDGKIPDWSTKSLPKAPKQDEESEDLELETPEEQRAARRRRDLKRTRGKGRRGKKASEAKPKEEKSKQAPEPSKSESSETEPAKGGRRAERERRDEEHREHPVPQPPTSEAVPDAPPAILPPDTVAEPPGRGEAATEPQAEAASEKQPSGARSSEKPSRRRRGGRGRRRGSSRRSEQQASEPKAQEPSEQKTERTDGRSEEKRSSSRSRSGRPSSSDSGRAEEKKAEPSRAERTEASSSSRFVIDLTSKSGRVRREEEEEEEERSSRKRRGGRRRSRSRRKGKGRSSKRGRSSGGSSSRPEKHLKQDQKLVVKITKEPISSKGPRVSTDVSLAGRFLVLIPQADYVAVSKKIESSKERRRLRALARSLLPEHFGLIVRTVAEGRDAKDLNTDLRLLLDKWKRIEDQLRRKPKPPKPLYEDVNMVSSIIRDLFSEDYDRIVVDDPAVHRNVKSYVEAVAPQMAPKVKLHESKEHVFRTYKVDRDVRAAFESRVPLKGGGYLFVEHTEAMHVVDVNSGRAGKRLSQEQNALRVNLESAREVAKQLRLRDLGGIICVDFIDMRSTSARRKLYDELKKEFKKDRAVTKHLPMSDFGVVQITRQRLRPSITTTADVDDLPEPLPEAEEPAAREERAPKHDAGSNGTATTDDEVPAAGEVVGRMEEWLMTYRDEVQEQHRKRPILVRVHPFLAAYLQRGVPSAVTRWRFRTRLKLKLDVDDTADPLAFSVRDEKSGKNLTKKYSK